MMGTYSEYLEAYSSEDIRALDCVKGVRQG